MRPLFFLFILAVAGCNNQPNSQKDVAKKDSTSAFPKRDSTKKKVILTFDDGPTTGSKKLYDLLLQEQIPVALYLVGEHYEKMPGLHKMLDSLRKQPYITLADHSYTHAWHNSYLVYYNHPNAVVDEYLKTEKLLGLTSHIARCAGRNVWRTSNLNITDEKGPAEGIDSLYKLGFQITGWDCTWPYDEKTFKNTRDVAGMMNRLHIYLDSGYSKQPNYVVVLGHDQQFADPDDFNQLKAFIDTIKNSKKYEFVGIKEYPGIK